MSDSLLKVTPLDLLGWLHCPKGALAGYVPEWPFGDLELAQKILADWPNETQHLRRICPSRYDAIQWLQATRFGIHRTTQPPIAPPRAKEEGDYWVGTEGYLHRESVTGGEIIIRFELPYLHKINGLWEIVFFDTHREPPPPSRRADMIMMAGLYEELFTNMTGQGCGSRLIAPAYTQEEIIQTPPQDVDLMTTLYEVVRSIGVIRIGEHCNSSVKERKNNYRPRWRCPLRENGDCEPWYPHIPANQK